MGLSLEFYAGDAETIGNAFTRFDFEPLRACNGSGGWRRWIPVPRPD